MVTDGGNLGAPPKPPLPSSYSSPRRPTAPATTSPGGGEGGTAIADCSRMPRVRASAWRITWSRRSRQASVTPSITWMNDAMPWRGSGGK